MARRWLNSTSHPKLTFAVNGNTPPTQLAVDGTVVERVMSSSVVDWAVETRVVGTATLDPEAGIVRAHVETLATPTTMGPLTGHVRSLSLVAPWTEGEPTTPADVPRFEL
ncbi:MAG: hypothetical protein R3F59_33275 [Myxococcota bacterium]